MPFDDGTVERNALTRPNANAIADPHVLDAHLGFGSVAHHVGRVRLQLQKSPDRLRASRLDDKGQPLRKDVVIADHHRDTEKGRRGKVGAAGDDSIDASGKTGERRRLEQDVLVDDPAAQRVPCPDEDLSCEEEDDADREPRGKPRDETAEIPRLPQPEKHQRVCERRRRTADCLRKTARPQHQKDEAEQRQRDEGFQHRIPDLARPRDQRERSQAEDRRPQESPAFLH